jgi:radical SAM superfamily enzyme YgiQ (UPF0313 family)
MKILFVYPEYPEAFWTFKYALKFVSRKSSNPPLGLLTVAAMVPAEWEKKLIDLNVTTLRDRDLQWADYVFLSAITVQKASVADILERCRRLGVKVVAGGPLFTSEPEIYRGRVDHLLLNEAELTLPPFLADLARGCAQPEYATEGWADLAVTPVPLWDLINLQNYATLNVQYSRGCPFNCDFCDITSLYGRTSRTKSTSQMLTELEALYARGWRGGVFLVDDNFIGNKAKLKSDLLPALAEWMTRHHHPFTLLTQASINLADDEELMRLMTSAGFTAVFVGIETPEEESLNECAKAQNRHRDLVACVEKMHRAGLQVHAGFIVGFDSDPHTIFERQIQFIQTSGVVTAMISLLTAVRGTKLYQRLQSEKRLLKNFSGNNTDYSLNFIPKMNPEILMNGYKSIIAKIYSPKHYYARVRRFLQTYRPPRRRFRLELRNVAALVKSFLVLGILGRERFQYWRLLLWSLVRRPRSFALAVSCAIYGFHYRKVFARYLKSAA